MSLENLLFRIALSCLLSCYVASSLCPETTCVKQECNDTNATDNTLVIVNCQDEDDGLLSFNEEFFQGLIVGSFATWVIVCCIVTYCCFCRGQSKPSEFKQTYTIKKDEDAPANRIADEPPKAEVAAPIPNDGDKIPEKQVDSHEETVWCPPPLMQETAPPPSTPLANGGTTSGTPAVEKSVAPHTPAGGAQTSDIQGPRLHPSTDIPVDDDLTWMAFRSGAPGSAVDIDPRGCNELSGSA